MVSPRTVRTLARLGLLGVADGALGLASRLRSAPRNRRLRVEQPGLELPPPDLAWDAYHHVDGALWLSTGEAHAEAFLERLERHVDLTDARVLEWGCGPARILRPMAARLAERGASLAGGDVSEASVAFSRRLLPDVEIFAHGPRPPLPLPDGSRDAAYAWSVLTHLGAQTQQVWIDELSRVLRPGGVLLVTAHGDGYRGRLTASERARYDAGQPVITADAPEGSKWCCAHHPPSWMRGSLLAGWEILEHEPGDGTGLLPQDVWLARRPGG
jgi:SAM-dependent methyltransferase